MKRLLFVTDIRAQLGDAYWYGTYTGQVTSETLLASKAKQYPGQYTESYIKRSRRWLDGDAFVPPVGMSKTPNGRAGTPCKDCVGLIKGTVWRADFGGRYQSASDLSANGMYNAASEKGPLSTLPDVPGILLWRDKHIGVYDGDGTAIESRGVDFGVVRTQVKDRGWTNWCKCHLIDYSDEGLVVSEARIRELETALALERSKNETASRTIITLTSQLSGMSGQMMAATKALETLKAQYLQAVADLERERQAGYEYKATLERLDRALEDIEAFRRSMEATPPG